MKAVTDSFRGLIATVISRALADLEKTGATMGVRDHVLDEAMSWINSPECEAFCYALDADYKTIREKAVALYQFRAGTDTGLKVRFLTVNPRSIETAGMSPKPRRARSKL
jgi:hypothetical protein